MANSSPLMFAPAEEQAPRRKLLVQIVDELHSLFTMLESLEAEGNPEHQEQIDLVRKQIVKALTEDLNPDVVAWEQRKLDLEVADLQDEATAIEEKIGRINAHKLWLRNLILEFMLMRHDPEPLKGTVASIHLRKPEGKKLDIFDEPVIPIKYFAQITSLVLDKDKIKADIEKGVSVIGARLKDREPYITITGAKTHKTKAKPSDPH
jgi:hypothetical protein